MRKKVIKEQCQTCGRQIGWIELFASLVLACFKLFVGIVSGSHALIGAAFYSIQDMMSAGIIIFSVKYSGRKMDEEHPYGYGKIEFIASVILSAGILVGALFLFLAAWKNILAGSQRAPGFIAFVAAVIAFFANELLYRFSMCVGTTLNSPAIISNAMHTRADSISSACVATGVIVAILGFRHIDPIIAIVEVLHISYISVTILTRGTRGLMDTALPPKEQEEIKRTVSRVPGIQEIVSLRTREVGQRREVDIEIKVAQQCKLEDANIIINNVKLSLEKEVSGMNRIGVYLVPDRTNLAEEKEKTTKIIGILQEYYRQFIHQHSLKIDNKKVVLSLNLLPEISLPTGQEVCNRIKKKIKEVIPSSEIIVDMETGN